MTGLSTGKGNHQSVSGILSRSFLYLMLFFLIIPGTILTVASYRRQLKYVSANIQIIAEKTALRFDGFISTRLQILKNTAWIADIASLSVQDQVEMLSRLLGHVEALQQAAFLDREGNLEGRFSLFGSSGSQHLTGFLQAQGKDLIKLREALVGEVHIDRSTNEPHVAAVVPVFDVFGDFQGVLVAELSLRFMWEFIGQVLIENGGYAYIVDSKGRLLAHPDLTRALAAENVSGLPIVADFLRYGADQTGTDKRYIGINGVPVVGNYYPVTATDWAVVTEIPWDRSFSPILRQVLFSAGMIILAALTAVLIGILLSRRITVPLDHLTSMVTRISGGEKNLRADLHGPREVSLLAAAFNSMTEQLNLVLRRLENRIQEIRKNEVSLRETNTRMQVLIDHSPIAVVLQNREGIIELWSKAAESIYGWKSGEVLGKELPVIPPGELGSYKIFFREIVERKDKVINRELQSLRKDGTRIWVNVSIAPLEDSSGDVYGIMNLVSDITEQKMAREQIVSSLREKEVLLREIHHRVKNNMQIISSMLSLQEDSIDDRIMKDVFQAGQQRIQSMGLIHEQLYMSDDFSRIDFSRYVESLSQYLLHSFDQDTAGIQFIADIAPVALSIETAVPCGLIINELLTNSMKHAFRGRNERKIWIEMKENTDNSITLTIGDNGVGLPSDEASGKRSSLGLVLVRELVLQLHGSLEYRREPGAVFRIVFPLDPASKSA
ncbi:histidine kinase dimerization/phosphoacceptor domain -containing protein [Marispirochaeta aestuarii]|uniref:sensor histidine kinase n=1 Tax=Marispirochaeta aestuarii TaxID=1963862 RepID=UPI002ABE3E73|nr:histidine kinase dimerization/phosphoacceptor domain -containing protein [Marispirochaeta aestuarii]